MSRQRIVECADLLAVANAERGSEGGAAVGVDTGMLPGAADGDIDGAGVDRVGAERFHVRHDALGRRALAGVDRADPARPDMAVGKCDSSHLAPVVLAFDHHAAALRVDRDGARGVTVQSGVALVVAGELDRVPLGIPASA